MSLSRQMRDYALNTEDTKEPISKYTNKVSEFPEELIDRIPVVDSEYRNASGRYYLRALFHEAKTYKQSNRAIYTLKDKDHPEGYISLYRVYMEEADLTEYIFASKYFDSYHQWTVLCECSWFKPYISRWRTELELLFKAQALQRLIKEAVEGGKNSYNANKFLIEKGWIDKSTEESRRGRPSKQEIARKAAEEVFSSNQISEAMKRLEIH